MRGDGEARGVEREEVVVYIINENFPRFMHRGDEVLGRGGSMRCGADAVCDGGYGD